MHINVYISIPISQFKPPTCPSPLSPLGVHTFVLYICVSISALQTGSSAPDKENPDEEENQLPVPAGWFLEFVSLSTEGGILHKMPPSLVVTVYIFWPCHTACGIPVPRPGIKPVPPAVEAQSLNHWTTKEVPSLYFLWGISYVSFQCQWQTTFRTLLLF